MFWKILERTCPKLLLFLVGLGFLMLPVVTVLVQQDRRISELEQTTDVLVEFISKNLEKKMVGRLD